MTFSAHNICAPVTREEVRRGAASCGCVVVLLTVLSFAIWRVVAEVMR